MSCLRTRASILSLLGCLLIIIIASPALSEPITRPHMPDEVIIKFKPEATQSQKDAILGDLGAEQIKHLKRIKSDNKRLHGVTIEDAIGRYKNHPAVEFIEPNYILTINDIPNDPRFDELWGMNNTGQTGGTAGADISAPSAWDVFTGSTDVVIGVIDTGVDYNHPDLAANIYVNPNEIPGNGIDDDGNGYLDDVRGWDFINGDNDPMDDNGHGTHCSGTIGGIGDNGIGVAGVNWHVSIMPLKFLSAAGSGSTTDAISCIEYATMMGVNLTSNSWGGGGFSEAMRLAIADAGAANILFVAAAGNSGSDNDTSPHYPSSYTEPNVVAVAATDHNDELASFSCYGDISVDLAAPGVDILSTLPGGSYGSLSGTSMATPHVSGALGLVFGRFPAIDALDAKALLLNMADPLPNLDGVVLTGARLNAFMPIAEPDSIPPGRILDLAVGTAGSNWLDVNWSAPGDDGDTGLASRYDLRYATSFIDETTWAAATPALGEPDPGSPGAFEQMRVAGLAFGTAYYLAVRALDEFGNAGQISNVAMGTTLGAPDVAVAPSSLSEALLTGGTAVQTLTLANAGAGTLDFTIPAPTLLGGPVLLNEAVDIPKGGLDARTGEPVTQGAGGPDAFGYRWVDSNDPFGPVFAWTDISGMGTAVLTSGDDSSVGPFPLGFTFPFYGADFTEFRVCSNGFISLSSSATAYSNQPLPSTGAPPHLIAPFWDDLTTSPGAVYTYDDGSRLIVQWNGVAHYGSGGPYSFQAILYPDGTIEYQYQSMGAPVDEATVGIQNGTGTDGLTVAFNTAYVADGLAVRIKAVPQWVTVAPAAGTVWAPGSTALDVAFDATGLVGGTYDGIIRILSNDPDEPETQVPVQLVVTGAPDILVAPLAYDFGDLFLGATASTTVMVRNTGTDLLTVSGIALSDPAFTADQNAFALAPGGSQPVVVTFAPASVQTYAAAMVVSSDAPSRPEVTVDLAGAGLAPPQFAVTPTSLSSDLYTGESEHQTFTLSNAGGSDFTFDLSVDFAAQVTVHDYVEVAKDGVDVRAGDPVTAGSGGPDLYGYRWIDSDEPGGPAFAWTDISTTGTPAFTAYGDDANRGPFPVGFTFPFYGNDFTQFRVCSNGWVSFTNTGTSYNNQLLPNGGSTVPENLLAAFWDDLKIDPANGSNVYYEYDGAKLTIQYHNVPRYSSGGPYTFQILLYPNGTIVYQYLTMAGTRLNEATVGIQNATKDDGLTVAFNTAYMHDGLAVRFQAFPEWLSVSPRSGVVPPGGSLPVTAAFNAAGLFGGTYEADVVITSNDPSVPVFPLPAVLHVTGAPDLAVSATAVDFGEVYLGVPTLRNLIVSNLGTDDLHIGSIAIDNPQFTTDMTAPLVLGPTQSLVATVGYNPTAVGPAAGVLTIASDDPDAPSLTVDLSGIGVSPPVASVAPASLSADLYTGESESRSLTLTNSGQSDLDFTVATLLGAADVVVADYVEVGKDDPDARPGILGSGGPDLYGYRWIDSDEPGGPVFNWIDISATGTPAFAAYGDDVNRGPFPVGFNFPFYGTAFSQFRVCSNGWLSFTSTSTSLSNQLLPNSGAPENLIAPFWDDLKIDPVNGSQVYYQYDGSKLIVQYDNVPRYGSGGPYTFQVLLYPSGTIVYQYLTMAGTRLNEATVGIQNADKTDGLTVAFNAAYIHDGLAVRLGAVGEWLAVTPANGTVPPGGSTVLNVVFNAEGLFGGDYDGAVLINNNDPWHGQLQVPALLHVTGAPVLAVEPAALDFGNVFIGYDDQLVLTVTNAGTDLLSVASVTASLPDYTATPAAFDLDPLESTTVTVTFAPTAEGSRAADLTFASNDAASPLVVPLAGNGLYPPVIAWSPDTIVGAAMPGGSKVKTLTVCNEGGSDLVWTLNAAESIGAAQVQYPDLQLGKEETDPRPGILGTGGPDTFGHTWTDSDEPGGPAFGWVDISTTGTPAFGVYSDDGNRGPFPIGFSFPFYGNTFDQFRVCSNGWISFTSTATSYTNQPLPSTGAPENLLAVFWDDMVVDPALDREIYYQFDGSRLIVQFDLRRIAATTPPFYSFQAILYPNGDILYQYDTLGATTNSATIGIQNATKDDGLLVAYNSAYVHEDMAILFTQRPSWLSAAPESGVIPAGQCAEIAVTMDAAALDLGDYSGTLTLTSNDPATPTATVPVLFHVAVVAAADADVEPNTLNLDSNGKWMTGRVELPAGYANEDVLIETVMFNGVVPADLELYQLDDDFNANGIPDMMFKFDRSAIEDILAEGEQVEVTISGEIRDTAFFLAVDTIRVIRPAMLSPNGGEVVLSGSRIDLSWTIPQTWHADRSDLYYSGDAGATWSLIAANVTATNYLWTTPAVVSDQVLVRVFAFDNQGLLGYDTTDEPFTLTDQASAVDTIVPMVYALGQNHPNPFNPRTKIAFDLPDAGLTRIAVYDLRGRLVKVLLEAPMPIGRHEVVWNGDDNLGQTVASGVYYYRITSGAYTATRSMTMLK